MDNEVERGLAAGSAEPRFLVVGRVIKPHGVRGEVRVEMHTDLPERFTWLETVYVDIDDPRPVRVESVRFHQSWVLLKLEGYDDRDGAESLRARWLLVPEEQGIPLEEGEYYLYQLVGLVVFTEEGLELGELAEVLETGANNVFVVRGEQGEVLIPDIEEVVREIDFESRRMIVRLLPGLVP